MGYLLRRNQEAKKQRLCDFGNYHLPLWITNMRFTTSNNYLLTRKK